MSQTTGVQSYLETAGVAAGFHSNQAKATSGSIESKAKQVESGMHWDENLRPRQPFLDKIGPKHYKCTLYLAENHTCMGYVTVQCLAQSQQEAIGFETAS